MMTMGLSPLTLPVSSSRYEVSPRDERVHEHPPGGWADRPIADTSADRRPHGDAAELLVSGTELVRLQHLGAERLRARTRGKCQRCPRGEGRELAQRGCGRLGSERCWRRRRWGGSRRADGGKRRASERWLQ